MSHAKLTLARSLGVPMQFVTSQLPCVPANSNDAPLGSVRFSVHRCVQFTPAELEMFRAVKRAYDPENLLNPEKNIPTLHRCAEFGRMHVKGGQLPHPELPRF
jgi:hypothetical protein